MNRVQRRAQEMLWLAEWSFSKGNEHGMWMALFTWADKCLPIYSCDDLGVCKWGYANHCADCPMQYLTDPKPV